MQKLEHMHGLINNIYIILSPAIFLSLSDRQQEDTDELESKRKMFTLIS